MFEDDYDIPLDDFDVPYVSIDEMRNILKERNDDKDIDLCLDEQTGLYYTEFFGEELPDLLHAHLLVELMMQQADEIDWARVTDGYKKYLIEFIEHTYRNPLVWQKNAPWDLCDKYVVVGKVAKEMSSAERNTCMPYDMFFTHMFYDERVLWFADHLPTGKDSRMPLSPLVEDFILWNYLIEEKGYWSLNMFEEEKKPSFIVPTFQRNIKLIAEKRGEAKAAEIVRKFREDWPDIISLKLFGVNKLSDEQIEDFRRALFEGMERSLRKWENQDGQKEESSAVQTAPCLLFTKKAKLENKTDEIAEALRNSLGSRSDKARAVVDEVHFWQKQGYIDAFYNARVMYDELAKIMTLPFKYSGFRKYYNE